MEDHVQQTSPQRWCWEYYRPCWQCGGFSGAGSCGTVLVPVQMMTFESVVFVRALIRALIQGREDVQTFERVAVKVAFVRAIEDA
jgi:hypothetical protein